MDEGRDIRREVGRDYGRNPVMTQLRSSGHN